MSDLNCSILCPPDVEEKLLDQLLIEFPDEMFTSTPTFGHGIAHGAMNPDEQVLGRARALLIQIVLNPSAWQTLRALLTRDFAGTGVRYWVTSVSEEGVCK
jgi:hypothetical protein